MPEYLDALREEATECIKATDGQWTNDTLKMMRKMDSFMKESQRVNHPAACTLPSILATQSTD